MERDKNKHYMQPYNVILYRAILLVNSVIVTRVTSVVWVEQGLADHLGVSNQMQVGGLTVII